MAVGRYFPFHVSVIDERLGYGEGSGQAISDRVVLWVWDTSDNTLATLYHDKDGVQSLNNPLVYGTNGDITMGANFYSDASKVNLALYDYGEDLSASDWSATTSKHSERLGRYAFLQNVDSDDPHALMVLPRHSSRRIIMLPFIATGTDANDTPVGFDNAEKAAVIAPGDSQEVYLSSQLVITGVYLNVRTVDSAITLEVGLDSGETNGDLDGFCNDVSLATGGFIRPGATITLGGSADYVSAIVRGALLIVDDTSSTYIGANTGAATLGAYKEQEFYVGNQSARTVTMKGLTTIDTAVGEVYLVGYMNPFFENAELVNNTGV